MKILPSFSISTRVTNFFSGNVVKSLFATVATMTVFLAFISVSVPTAHASPTTWYVSNVAMNNYALGSDSGNNGLSSSTPFLTINKAVTSASAGDTIIINPTSASKTAANHPYVENSGSGYLTISSAITVEGDPFYSATAPNGGTTYAVVQATSTSRVLNIGSVSGALVISDLVFDAQSTGGKNGIVPHADTNTTFRRITGVNVTSAFIGGPTVSSSNNFILDRCVLDPTATGTFFQDVGGGSITIEGGNYPINTSNQQVFIVGASGVNTTNFTIAQAPDGSSVNFSGNGIPVIFYGTTTNLIAAYFNFNNTQRGLYFASGDASIAVTGTFDVSNFTNTYGSNSTYSLIGPLYETINCPNVHDGTDTNNTSVVVDTLAIIGCTGSPSVYNMNVVNTLEQAHSIIIGEDGMIPNAQNNGSQTGTQALGDSSSDTSIDQFMTNVAYDGTYYLGSTDFTMQSVGSPSGNITVSAYTDSAGVPGSLIETSNTVIPASSLTSSMLQYQFNFANRTHVAPGSKIHYVINYSGLISSSNYIQLAKNGTVTAGNIEKYNGSTWTSDGSNALLFAAYYGTYGIVDPVVRNNTITASNPGANETHMIIIGGTTRGRIYQNQIYGGSLGLLFKDTTASASNRAYAYSNVYYSNLNNSGGMAYAKGAQYVSYFNNTIILDSGSTGYAFEVNPDSQANAVNQQMPDNIVFENNTIIDYSTQSGSYAYSSSANAYGSLPTNITIKNNDVYAPSSHLSSWNGTTYSTWNSWQVAGFDSNSINTDPQLQNEINPSTAANFTPLSTSPAIDLGTTTAINFSTSTDYFGNPLYGAPDAGAIEYQPPFTIGTNLVDATGNIRIYGDSKYRYTSATSSTMFASFSALPSGGPWSFAASTTRPSWLDVSSFTWATSSPYTKQWTAATSTATTTIYAIGNMQANAQYPVMVNGATSTYVTGAGCTNGVCTADGTGKVNFTYSGGYSSPVVFGLTQGSPASVLQPSISSITQTSVLASSTITSVGSGNATIVGFNYGTTISYGSTASTTGSFGIGQFSQSITGLSCNTTYHIQAFATNPGGVATSSDQTFTTSPCVPGAPTGVTASTSTPNQASVSWTAPVSNGGSAITYYSIASNPAVFFATTSGTSIVATGLTNGTAYTFSVSATNVSGTGATSTASSAVTPVASLVTASVLQPSISSITQTSVLASSTITSVGSGNATIVGFNYGTTISYGSTASTTGSFGIGQFSQSITGLSCNTTYHIQAFATNPGGVAYSADQVMTTSACPQVQTNTQTYISGGGGGGSSASYSTLAAFQASTSAAAQSRSAATNCPANTTCTPIPGFVQPAASGNASLLTRTLGLGDTGDDVRTLQVFLNEQGFTVADSGPGSPGHETNLFGPATKKALAAFQKAHADILLAPQGFTSPTGIAGPATDAYINQILNAAATADDQSTIAASTTAHAILATSTQSRSVTASTSQAFTFTRILKVGSIGEDVRQLQIFLNSHGFTVAATGPGSSGQETDTFGSATRAALMFFQKSYGITTTGSLGPKTMGLINGFGNQ